MNTSKNFIWKLGGSLLGGGINFLFMVFLMGRLGPAEYGKLAFALSWAGLFCILVDYGFNPLVTRDVGREPQKAKSYFTVVIRAKVLLTVIALALMMAVSTFYPPARQNLRLIIAAYVFLVSASFVESGQAFSYVLGVFNVGALLFVLHRLCVAGAGSLKALSVLRALPIVTWMAMGGMVGAGITLVYFMHMLKGGPFGKDLPRATLRELAWKALPLLFQGIFIVIYFRIDTVLLAWLRGDVDTGLYNAGYRFFEVANIVPTAYMAAIAAAYTRALASPGWRQRFLRHSLVSLALGATGCMFLEILSFGLTRIFLPSSYVLSQTILRILGLALLFLYPNYLFTTTLIYLHKQAYPAIIAACCVVFNVGLNLYVIPRWSGIGAAWMTVATEALISLLCLILLWPFLKANRAAIDPLKEAAQ